MDLSAWRKHVQALWRQTGTQICGVLKQQFAFCVSWTTCHDSAVTQSWHRCEKNKIDKHRRSVFQRGRGSQVWAQETSIKAVTTGGRINRSMSPRSHLTRGIRKGHSSRIHFAPCDLWPLLVWLTTEECLLSANCLFVPNGTATVLLYWSLSSSKQPQTRVTCRELMSAAANGAAWCSTAN